MIIMMMRPRNYGTLNRCIARSITYALRDSNRKKYSKNNSNTYTNQNPSTTPSNTKKPDEADVIMGLLFLFVLIILPCIVPEILFLYLLGFVLILLS